MSEERTIAAEWCAFIFCWQSSAGLVRAVSATLASSRASGRSIYSVHCSGRYV
jgi:hypothetical protein